MAKAKFTKKKAKPEPKKPMKKTVKPKPKKVKPKKLARPKAAKRISIRKPKPSAKKPISGSKPAQPPVKSPSSVLKELSSLQSIAASSPQVLLPAPKPPEEKIPEPRIAPIERPEPEPILPIQQEKKMPEQKPAPRQEPIVQKKEEPIEPRIAPAAPITAGIKPAPKPPEAQKTPSAGVPITPSFELMPPWQDKDRLRSFQKDEAVSLSMQQPGSPASEFLSEVGRETDASQPGYFLVQEEKEGRIVGAVEGYILEDTIVFMRARAQGKGKRELHSLLYCAAMAYFKSLNPAPKNAIYICPRTPFTQEMAGKLLFLGRRAGMRVIPADHLGMLIFIRRLGKEYDLIANGREIAAVLRKISPIYKLDPAIRAIEAQPALQLISLPMSPDSRSRLHELEDAVVALGLDAKGMGEIIEHLKDIYVYERRDVTPESF